MKLGAQFFTLRDYCGTNEMWENTLKKVADIGYEYIQLTAQPDYDADFMAEACNKYGLSVVVTHNPQDRLIHDTDTVIANHKKIGCSRVGVGALPNLREKISVEHMDNFINDMRPVIQKLKAAGMVFSYHNHDAEMAKVEGTDLTYLDYICEKISADEMIVTMDTYWIQAGGGDPASWIRKLKGRMPCIHFKDMVYNIPYKRVHIAPIGEGNMNYDAIVEACLECGVEYGLVELDDCYGEDPFACLERSYRFLTERYNLK